MIIVSWRISICGREENPTTNSLSCHPTKNKQFLVLQCSKMRPLCKVTVMMVGGVVDVKEEKGEEKEIVQAELIDPHERNIYSRMFSFEIHLPKRLQFSN